MTTATPSDGGRNAIRSLHCCNLANVAYGYCKILRADEHELSLHCHDLRHVMSQPEWDDLELRADQFPDEYDFFNNTVDFGDYRRPAWFSNAGIFPSSQEVEAIVDASEHGETAEDADAPAEPAQGARTADVVAPTPRFGEGARRLWLGLPQSVRRPLKRKLRTVDFALSAANSELPTAKSLAEYSDLAKRNVAEIIARSKDLPPEHHVNEDMIGAFLPHAWWAQRHSREADVIMAYVLTPIYAMILGDRPFVSIEIGTMREIPFDGTDTGRLLGNAYRASHHTLITNPDVRAQADQLGVESYTFCPHPLDEDTYAPTEQNELRAELQKRHNIEKILFAPARQNWDVKGNDRYLKAFAEIRKDRSDVGLIIPGWGQEVERSQELCRELGVADSVVWIEPQSEAALVKYYNASDIVLDQFILGVFGLTSPKAMAASAVVLTSYDPEIHEWAFDEHPPLVPATETEEIVRELRDLLDRPERLAELGAASRDWVMRHHSKAIIRNRLEEGMGIAQDRFERELALKAGNPASSGA